MLQILMFISLSWASDLPGEEIFVAQKNTIKSEPQNITLPQEVVREAPTDTIENTLKLQSSLNVKKATSIDSNLPNEYRSRNLTSEGNLQSALVQPKANIKSYFKALKVGEQLQVKVTHSVIAFSDEKSPVIAEGLTNRFKGIKFIGESRLEPNTQRIFIDFKRVIVGDKEYEFEGVAVSTEGQPGLKGVYHSKELKYFGGDFVASFMAAYFDGLIPRRSNIFGQIETDASVDNAVKRGFASGALSTANRFREKLRNTPEFSELKGPFELKLMVLDL